MKQLDVMWAFKSAIVYNEDYDLQTELKFIGAVWSPTFEIKGMLRERL